MAHSTRPAHREPDPQLTVQQLYAACDPATLGFATTADVGPLSGTLAQTDAVDALEFGVRLSAPGYNIFVVGRPGSGRMSTARRVLAARAARAETPPDWCYVYNFADARRPTVLRLPAGQGPVLCAALEALVADLRRAIPEALETEAVAAQRLALVEQKQKVGAEALEALKRDLGPDPYVALVGPPASPTVVPARGHEPLESQSYNELAPELRAEIDAHVEAARHRLFTTHRRLHELAHEAEHAVRELNRDVARGVVDQSVAELRQKYDGDGAVLEYIEALSADVLSHVEAFYREPQEQEATDALAVRAQADFFRRYQVRVVVSNDPDGHAPVVEESHPTLINLLGRIERQLEFGVLRTDFTQIMPGALHRANGGYLLLDAAEVLSRPLAWPALKRALQTRELKPAEAAAELGLVATESLEPEPIPLDAKVVLVGEPGVHHLLETLDSDFTELFRVKSDFAPFVERTPESERGYAAFVAEQCATESLPPLDASAIARAIEHGSRLAGDQRRLTTRLREIADLVREAAYWAAEERGGDDAAAGASAGAVVRAEHVAQALAQRERRDRRLERELLEMIERGVLRFQPTGEGVGQLYGIGLLSTGQVTLGRPIRVMASAYLGRSGVLDIEREAKLSGRIHTKGFLVLSGYLGRLFARANPLILTASLSFDQLYEEVEGDSASAAELYALLSAIGGVPLRQGIAVTGAVNQEGAVLPVGGVTEKVEGYFAACQRVGLTGEQGVVLPRRNVDNLTLRQDVRDAVAAERFRIYAIERVEEGWPILAGREAGDEIAAGQFMPGSVHDAVAGQLAGWAEQWAHFAEAGPASEPALGRP